MRVDLKVAEVAGSPSTDFSRFWIRPAESEQDWSEHGEALPCDHMSFQEQQLLATWKISEQKKHKSKHLSDNQVPALFLPLQNTVLLMQNKMPSPKIFLIDWQLENKGFTFYMKQHNKDHFNFFLNPIHLLSHLKCLPFIELLFHKFCSSYSQTQWLLQALSWTKIYAFKSRN